MWEMVYVEKQEKEILCKTTKGVSNQRGLIFCHTTVYLCSCKVNIG